MTCARGLRQLALQSACSGSSYILPTSHTPWDVERRPGTERAPSPDSPANAGSPRSVVEGGARNPGWSKLGVTQRGVARGTEQQARDRGGGCLGAVAPQADHNLLSEDRHKADSGDRYVPEIERTVRKCGRGLRKRTNPFFVISNTQYEKSRPITCSTC